MGGLHGLAPLPMLLSVDEASGPKPIARFALSRKQATGGKYVESDRYLPSVETIFSIEVVAKEGGTYQLTLEDRAPLGAVYNVLFKPRLLVPERPAAQAAPVVSESAATASSRSSARPLPRWGVLPRLGVVLAPDSRAANGLIGLSLRTRLGEQVHLELGVEHFRLQLAGEIEGRPDLGSNNELRIRYQATPLRLGGAYRQGIGTLDLYVGAGVAVTLGSVELDAFGDTFHREDRLLLGGSFFSLGLDRLLLGKAGVLSAELRLLVHPLRFGDSQDDILAPPSVLSFDLAYHVGS